MTTSVRVQMPISTARARAIALFPRLLLPIIIIVSTQGDTERENK